MINPISLNYSTRNVNFTARHKVCNILKCQADCCNNAPLPLDLLSTYKTKIVNPVITIEPLGFAEGRLFGFPITNPKNLFKNKCPFLTPKNTCNIYENRPLICKEYGTLDEPDCHCNLQE